MDVQSARRERMVRSQLLERGVDDRHVLAAMRRVPRERFVPPALRERAYDDSPLPIDAGQTISQPCIVGLMVQAAGIESGSRVLEIGAGSGYDTPVLHDALADSRLQRCIGVIYRPGSERASHYAQASLSRQYDAYGWFARTRAVQAAPGTDAFGHDAVPDTWPFAL